MNRGIARPGEFELIGQLTKHLKPGERVQRGVGDDCAIVAIGDRSVLLTCDASLEDVHFRRNWGRPRDIGWKAAVSGLSDIAAMGGRADSVLVTLAIPEDVDLDYIHALYGGVVDAVEAAGAAVVGGDTTASRSGIVIDIMVTGEVVGRPLLRRGAAPGDLIAATGMIGARGAGLHALLNGIDAPERIDSYLRPEPRLAEGQWLQAQAGVRAMMDLSDGLLPDSGHIARASGVGIDLRSDLLPANAELEAYWHAQGHDCAAERFRSGEEYELLVVLAASEADECCRAFHTHFDLPLSIVGACTDAVGSVRIDGEVPARPGFEHFQAPAG